MAKQKQVVAQVKVQIPGGQATPAPPVGTSLGPHGVNIGQFVQQFNERTRAMNGTVIPAIITIYNDRTFEFVLKSPPASVLLKQAAQIAKGSGNPKAEKVGTVTRASGTRPRGSGFQITVGMALAAPAKLVARDVMPIQMTTSCSMRRVGIWKSTSFVTTVGKCCDVASRQSS